jgi:hypothetical protein
MVTFVSQSTDGNADYVSVPDCEELWAVKAPDGRVYNGDAEVYPSLDEYLTGTKEREEARLEKKLKAKEVLAELEKQRNKASNPPRAA